MVITHLPAKNWLKSIIVRLTSSKRAQQYIQQNVQFLLELMGIGSGSAPAWSGEKNLGTLLRTRRTDSGLPLCIFDVGAGSGQFLSILIQPLEASRVPFLAHVFEPSPVAFRRLQASFGDRPEMSLNNLGLGHTAGEFELFSDGAGSMLASLSRRRLDHFGIGLTTSERVRLETLDEYCRQRAVSNIDLLKLDVEGHELSVLQGGLRMIREHRIEMVSFEFGGANIDSRTFFQDFWYFFQDNCSGTLHRISPSGNLIPLLQYDEIYEQFRNTNFLFIASDAGPQTKNPITTM